MDQPSAYLESLVRQLRSDAGLSARALAEAAGIDHTTLSRLGRHRVDSKSLAKLLAYYSAPPDVFVSVIQAHIWDELTRAGVDPSRFWTQIIDSDFAWFSALRPSIQADIEVLGKNAMTNRHLELTLSGMAEASLRAQAEQADRANKIYQIPRTTGDSIAAEDILAPKKSPRKNAGAPTARPSLPPKSKAS